MEPIDEVAVTNLQSYKDKKFVDISKEDLELGKRLLCTRYGCFSVMKHLLSM